ncbi:Zinc finger and Nuclear hormone receptor domain containing protein [Aphelenchoides fujianensis]|nr:Zinc finger and Nuclear hormone receptor domain containing protein [Aphelenchoides fujianensis]
MASSEKLPAGTLCTVCLDQATGRHYNVAACSGCKTFFRRAIVNNRNFKCMGNGNCPVNKDVRCACRACRFQKCLAVGMDQGAIQSSRDRIGYTRRIRKNKKEPEATNSPRINGGSGNSDVDEDDVVAKFPSTSHGCFTDFDIPTAETLHYAPKGTPICDPLLERLTMLENNFSLLLSRGHIATYGSLDEALAAPSIFTQPIDVKLSDPIAAPEPGQSGMPFWRSRIVALFIDYLKTFGAFRKLPYADKIALINNHASSYMIMCEAFRTPTKISDEFVKSTHYFGGISPTSGLLYNSPMPSNNPDFEEAYKHNETKAEKLLAAQEEENSVHNVFDPDLISSGSSCAHTGARSIVDVPPEVHYPSVGSLSGLAPVMSAMIEYVMHPFRRLAITTTEFATLQAIMFFDPDTEGLDAASQRNVAAEQKRYLSALYAHISRNHEKSVASDRYASIILRVPTIRKVAAKKNESLQIIDMFSLFNLNALVRETALGIRPNNGRQHPNAQQQQQTAVGSNIKKEPST